MFAIKSKKKNTFWAVIGTEECHVTLRRTSVRSNKTNVFFIGAFIEGE